MPIIGVDFGGVISSNTGPSIKSADYRKILPVPGALEGITAMIKKYWPVNVFIISKASISTQTRILELLKIYNFYRLTGFDPKNLYFCLRIEDKAPLAAKLKLTHFIDNHHPVLEHMEKVVPHCILFKPSKNTLCDCCILAKSWSEIMQNLP